MHRHSHSHDHAPAPIASRERRAFGAALALTALFAIVEAVGGWWAGSLALLSDAGHMVTDVAALSIALIAQRIAQRPPSHRASYGYARAEVLAAFINALIMLGVVVWIAVEAGRRLLAPAPVAGGVVILVAAAGLTVNLLCAWLLSHGKTLNSRAALLHVLSDLAASFAALTAGIVLTVTGWLPIDPILSLFVAVLILRVKRPDVKRPFRCPLVFIVAPLGIMVNVLMMLFLPEMTWYRLFGWLIIGLVIYFAYGYWNSALAKREAAASAE